MAMAGRDGGLARIGRPTGPAPLCRQRRHIGPLERDHPHRSCRAFRRSGFRKVRQPELQASTHYAFLASMVRVSKVI